MAGSALAAPQVFLNEFDTWSTGSSCSSEWTGACSDTWRSGAEDDSLSMAYAVTVEDEMEYGVLLYGAEGALPNAVSKDFDVVALPDGYLELNVLSWALNSSTDASIRIQALNASDVVIGTFTVPVNTDSSGRVTNNIYMPIKDASVEKFRVTIGARAATELWIEALDVVYGDTIDVPGATSSAECSAACVGQTCDGGGTPSACNYTWTSGPFGSSCTLELKGCDATIDGGGGDIEQNVMLTVY